MLLLRARLFFHQFWPFVILSLLVVLDSARLFSFLSVEPLFLFPLIYRWSIYRPEYLSVSMLFVLGVLSDVMSGVFVGQTSLVLLMLYALTLVQRHHVRGATFSVIWFGFGCYMVMVSLLEWSIASIVFGYMVPAWDLSVQHLLVATLYPWFHKIFWKIEKKYKK